MHDGIKSRVRETLGALGHDTPAMLRDAAAGQEGLVRALVRESLRRQPVALAPDRARDLAVSEAADDPRAATYVHAFGRAGVAHLAKALPAPRSSAWRELAAAGRQAMERRRGE